MIASGSDLLLSLLALPVLAASAYLALLALLSRRVAPRPPRNDVRFSVVVPAHDEMAGVGATVRSLLALRYPADRFRVVVVADNCTDGTAQVAQTAGARVLVRQDASRRGKGYALAHAFEVLGREGFADAYVVVDADTIVSANLLEAFAARFAAGASAVQAEYGVRNPGTSWRTRLLRIALALFHGVRSLGRERLGLSSGLRGNGMGFSARLLNEVPHDSFSIVEDLEYGIRIGQAGHRVAYVSEAGVLGEMAAAERTSRSQRRRWEGGRMAIARREWRGLVGRGLRERSGLLLDLAMDLLVPPLSTLTLACAAGLLLCGLGHLAGLPLRVAPVLWGAAALSLLLYVARGLAVSGAGLRGVLDLAWAPAYVIWKLALAFTPGPKRPDTWVRTEREQP